MAIDPDEMLRGVNLKDLQVWEKVYSSYYAALCSYANAIVKNSDSAQDIVQDTLIKIWYSDRIFADIMDFTWYLYRAVYNNSLYHLRSFKSQQHAIHKMHTEEPELSEEQFAFTVQDELIRQLYLYIEDLPKERKEIILLSLKGYSGQEIAEKLSITINTVKKQKNRGFKYLREKLQGTIWVFLI